MTLTQAAELPEQSTRARGGLLAAALPVPAGWQQGLAVPFYSCGEPILRDKCIAGVDDPHRTDFAEFHPFPIEQGAVCATVMNGLSTQEDHATARLDATTEWALGRQLATDQVGNGSPSLADGTNLGTVADGDFIQALSCLEQAAADAGFGTRWWLHAPVRAAAWLASLRLSVDGQSPTGAPWVFSPGYPVEGATTVRLWVTGPVWAAVDSPDVRGVVDWRVNSDAAFAMRAGIVAFDPCLNLSIDVTVPACPA